MNALPYLIKKIKIGLFSISVPDFLILKIHILSKPTIKNRFFLLASNWKNKANYDIVVPVLNS